MLMDDGRPGLENEAMVNGGRLLFVLVSRLVFSAHFLLPGTKL